MANGVKSINMNVKVPIIGPSTAIKEVVNTARV